MIITHDAQIQIPAGTRKVINVSNLNKIEVICKGFCVKFVGNIEKQLLIKLKVLNDTIVDISQLKFANEKHAELLDIRVENQHRGGTGGPVFYDPNSDEKSKTPNCVGNKLIVGKFRIGIFGCENFDEIVYHSEDIESVDVVLAKRFKTRFEMMEFERQEVAANPVIQEYCQKLDYIRREIDRGDTAYCASKQKLSNLANARFDNDSIISELQFNFPDRIDKYQPQIGFMYVSYFVNDCVIKNYGFVTDDGSENSGENNDENSGEFCLRSSSYIFNVVLGMEMPEQGFGNNHINFKQYVGPISGDFKLSEQTVGVGFNDCAPDSDYSVILPESLLNIYVVSSSLRSNFPNGFGDVGIKEIVLVGVDMRPPRSQRRLGSGYPTFLSGVSASNLNLINCYGEVDVSGISESISCSQSEIHSIIATVVSGEISASSLTFEGNVVVNSQIKFGSEVFSLVSKRNPETHIFPKIKNIIYEPAECGKMLLHDVQSEHLYVGVENPFEPIVRKYDREMAALYENSRLVWIVHQKKLLIGVSSYRNHLIALCFERHPELIEIPTNILLFGGLRVRLDARNMQFADISQHRHKLNFVKLV